MPSDQDEVVITQTTPDDLASWIVGRVYHLSDDRVAIHLHGEEHIISRRQAVALGTRLLQVGIGTSFYQERVIHAKIGDILAEAREQGLMP